MIIYRGKGIKYKKNTQTSEVNKWPKKIFFGWGKGLSLYTKSYTIEDPKDAIKKTPSSVLYVRIVSAPMVIMEKKAAKHDFFISSLFIL